MKTTLRDKLPSSAVHKSAIREIFQTGENRQAVWCRLDDIDCVFRLIKVGRKWCRLMHRNGMVIQVSIEDIRSCWS